MPGPNMLITGGEEATPHEYPWMAALFFEQGAGNTYFCGGTLVNDNWTEFENPLKQNKLKKLIYRFRMSG